MTEKNAHQNLKKKYLLFNGKKTTSRAVALKEQQDFINAFPFKWDESDADQRFELIHYISELSPEEGINLVFYGMQDFTRAVKIETKKILILLADKVKIKQNRLMSQKVAIRSEVFAKRIYFEMAETLSLDELEMYLSILLDIGGRGSFFAWRFFTDNTIPPNIFLDILKRLSEKLQLRFARYYFTTELSDKRKYANFIRKLLKGINDSDEAAQFIISLIESDTECPHASISLNGTILTDFIHQVNISEKCLSSDPANKSYKDKIICVKIAGIIDKKGSLYKFLPLLDKSEPRNVRLACIKVIGNSHTNQDLKIKNALLALLEDDDKYIIINTLKALIRLEVPDIIGIIIQLVKQQSHLRAKIYNCLSDLESGQLITILDMLEEPFATDARRTIGKILIKRNPERLEVLLEFHKNNQDSKANKDAQLLYETIKKIKEAETKVLNEKNIPDPVLKSIRVQKLIKKLLPKKQLKKLKDLTGRDPEIKLRLYDEFYTDMDISGFKIENVDFNGSTFLNTDLSSTYFKDVSFKNVRFESTSLENALFENVIFDNCILLNAEAHAANFKQCSFSNASICNSSFEFAEMAGAYFTGATIINCNFAKTELSFASFTGSNLYMSSFKHASFYQAAFVVTKGMLSDFSETNITETAKLKYSDLNARLKDWNKVEIPSIFYEKELLETNWQNILILTNEMDLQRDIFFKYNRRRKKFAVDTFRPEQEDLFEIIPLLLHLTQLLVPIEQKKETILSHENTGVRNMASGIYGYVPSQNTVRLAKKYLKCDKLLLLPGKQSHIEALFTIGSLGTIAQSSTSDIDYWVCINKNRMDEDAVAFLKLKLEAIEKWAKLKFNTELHFFILDAASIREGRFGGSDFESSGSAQGMILKEEFYRTMILISGKIPFWCVLPAWTADNYYNLLYLTANRFHNDYLDFGNVSVIPSGEYFGASMWQLFKSLTSPYKSVMKMALLEKYIQEKKKSRLLCNLLKKKWATGKCNFRHQDPYLLLFEEISNFYNSSNQKDIQSLVRICFFFKLGIRSMTELDKSVFKIRKTLVQKCIENFAWEESMLCELGYFDEWSFEKIVDFSNTINHFMIESYRKLSGHLNKSTDSETTITDRDLTMLGRKMFVQFVPQPHKVQKLPHVTEGRRLFKQLYIYFRQSGDKKPAWEVYSEYNKNEIIQSNSKAILKGIEHIEEIAALSIQNDLLNCGTNFNILPNPTFVSAQDFIELINEMTEFFISKGDDSVSANAFLKNYVPIELYVIINFNDNRKADKIFDYVAVYRTSWGELYCRYYHSKEGLTSLSEAIENIQINLSLTFENTRLGYHIPKMSRKRIKITTDG